MSIPVPTLDASTVAGQVQWFLYGFGYAAVIGTVVLMIRIFKHSAGPRGPFDV